MNINGDWVVSDIDPRTTLLDFLRDHLGLTGTKRGCDEGECGVCTVLLENQPVNACLTLAAKVHRKHVMTIEGLKMDGKLHPLQEAFIKHGAIQCGFCTPGMILTVKALMDKTPHPTEAQVKKAISGNLCRCTGYQQIVEATLSLGETHE